MVLIQHLKGPGCAEATGPDSDVSGPALSSQSAEAEGRLLAPQGSRGQDLQKPEALTCMSVAQVSVCQCAQTLCLMVPRGLEPRTLRLLAVRSNQLSYETSWCFLRDSLSREESMHWMQKD